MITSLITGGANGIGKEIAINLLKQGQKVIVVSSSNGMNLINEVHQLNLKNNLVYIQANLNLISENNRILNEVSQITQSLDQLIFCATRHNLSYSETSEGFESSFALDYLSRFILSYGFKSILEKSQNPLILNLCGTGYNGEVDWDDLQHKNDFKPMKVMMHGSRLNELLAVAFTQNDRVKKIKYILYNPSAVSTEGMNNFYKNPLLKLLSKLVSKTPNKAALIIINLLKNIPAENLSAFNQKKKLDLNNPTFDKDNAAKLFRITGEIINNNLI